MSGTEILSRDPAAAIMWVLKLFVVGDNANSAIAINNLQKLVAAHFPPGTRVEVIDLSREPNAPGSEDVLAVPMLVRDRPKPIRRIIGDLSDTSRVLQGLGIAIPD